MSDPYQEAFEDLLKDEPLQQRLARERVLARRKAQEEGTTWAGRVNHTVEEDFLAIFFDCTRR